MMLTTFKHNQRGKVKPKKWKGREDAQALNNDHGSFWRALRRGLLARSNKKIIFIIMKFSRVITEWINKC